MNQVEVLRKVLRDSLVRHEGHVALDRLARLVEADSAVNAGRDAVEAACHGTDAEFQLAVERLDKWELLQKECLAAVLGEGE